ncbi:MAG: hypothetical protein ABIR46_03910, partial [Candidatus Saccharimonadales bacterium]
MRGKQTLVINGKVYDAITGLPSAAPDVASRPVAPPVSTQTIQSPHKTVTKPIVTRSAHHAANSHVVARKSQTLHRAFLKKPATEAVIGTSRRKPAAGHTQKSPLIQRFAAHPQPLQTAQVKPVIATVGRMNSDISPAKHVVKPAAIVTKVQSLVARPVAVAIPVQPNLNTRSVKEQLITKRMATANVDSHKDTSKKAHGGLLSRKPRLASMVSASFAVIVLGGYFTYLNMPGLSVRVAAAQADVAASFPDYHPDGYRFNGPVAFAPGQVAIDFVANGGNTTYTVTEQKSSWDSQAVYDNVVAKTAEDSYVTNSQQGLTIYTFKGEAAWVNKGILYTISGDAPLSNEQLLR